MAWDMVALTANSLLRLFLFLSPTCLSGALGYFFSLFWR